MTTLYYEVVHIHDLAEERDTTILVAVREYPTGHRALILHQIEGTYFNEKDFQTVWDSFQGRPGIDYFTEMTLDEAKVLALKLQNVIDQAALLADYEAFSGEKM